MENVKQIIQQTKELLFSSARQQPEAAAAAPAPSAASIALSQIRSLASGDLMTVFGTNVAAAFLSVTHGKELDGVKHTEKVPSPDGELYFAITHYPQDSSPYLSVIIGYPGLTTISFIYYTNQADCPESDVWSKVLVTGYSTTWKLRDLRESNIERANVLRVAAEGHHKDRLMEIRNEAKHIISYLDGSYRGDSAGLNMEAADNRVHRFMEKVGEYAPLVASEVAMVNARHGAFVANETKKRQEIERVTALRREYFDRPYRTWLMECSAVWTHNNEALIRMQKEFGNKSITIKRLGFMAPGQDEGGPFAELNEQLVVTVKDAGGEGGPLVFTDTGKFYRRPRPGRYGEQSGSKMGFESVRYRHVAYETEAETVCAIDLREYNYNLGVEDPFLPPVQFPMYTDALPEGHIENMPYAVNARRNYHTLIFSRLFWSLDDVQERMKKELLPYPKCPVQPERDFTLPTEVNQELTRYALRQFNKVFHNKTDAELDAEEAEQAESSAKPARAGRPARRPVQGHPNTFHQDNYPDGEDFDDPFAGD